MLAYHLFKMRRLLQSAATPRHATNYYKPLAKAHNRPNSWKHFWTTWLLIVRSRAHVRELNCCAAIWGLLLWISWTLLSVGNMTLSGRRAVTPTGWRSHNINRNFGTGGSGDINWLLVLVSLGFVDGKNNKISSLSLLKMIAYTHF